jgi:hypothetical protein
VRVRYKGLRLELGTGCPYSSRCREEVFPETVLPAYGVLGNRASGDADSRKLSRHKESWGVETPALLRA